MKPVLTELRYNWLKFDQFSCEVDRLSLMVGVASRAERLRIAQRVVRHRTKDGIPQSDKDLLEWLKFAQSETDGSKTRVFDPEEFDRELNNLMKQQATRIVEALLIEYPELDLNRAEAIVSESLGVKVESELVS